MEQCHQWDEYWSLMHKIITLICILIIPLFTLDYLLHELNTVRLMHCMETFYCNILCNTEGKLSFISVS